jgi:PAS domain-containing protein
MRTDLYSPEGLRGGAQNQHRQLDPSDHPDENGPWRLHEGKIVEILERISDAFYAVDRQWRIVYVNRRDQQLCSRCQEELLGKNMWDEFRQALGSEFHRQINRAMEEGVTTDSETGCPLLSTWIAGRATNPGTGYRCTSRT